MFEPRIKSQVPEAVLQVYGTISKLLRGISLSREVSVHGLCRGIATYFNRTPPALELQHGYFAGTAHSWIKVTQHRNWLLDVAPSHCIRGPLILDVGSSSPWNQLYRAPDLWLGRELENPELEVQAAEVFAAIRRHVLPGFYGNPL